MDILAEKNVLGRSFKIYGDAENPLFLAKDVASWIGHTNANMMLNLVEDNEKVLNNAYTLKGNQESWFLTESGVYEVLMQSRKPIAKVFKKKVKEILKSIRRKGGYIATTPNDNQKDILAKALLIAQKTIDENKTKIQSLEDRALENRPKIIFAEAVESSNHSILVGELAKIIKQKGYDIGQQRLFAWLRENNYLMKKGEAYNLPTQKSMEMRLFEVKENFIIRSDGHKTLVRTPKVTGKGQVYFINLFIKKLYEEKYGECL